MPVIRKRKLSSVQAAKSALHDAETASIGSRSVGGGQQVGFANASYMSQGGRPWSGNKCYSDKASFTGGKRRLAPLSEHSKRGSVAVKRGKKVRVVSEAVAVSRLQRWCRCRCLMRLLTEQPLRDTVRTQKTHDEKLEIIRAKLAKCRLKMFFNSLASAEYSREESLQPASSRRKHHRFASMMGDESDEYSLVQEKKTTEDQRKRLSSNSALRNTIKQVTAVQAITRWWCKTKTYQVSQASANGRGNAAQSVFIRREEIERRDIIRRHYLQIISMYQECAKLTDVKWKRAANDLSVMLFGSDAVLSEIADDVKKPFGTGPYHPYSTEELSDDYKTLRILERRFMFSKEDRRVLQEEGILDVNEPRSPVEDPDFVFGAPMDYLRPGELADRIRNEDPSLELGIRRTSSLVLDKNWRIIGSKGEDEVGAQLKLKPSPRMMRESLAVLHGWMKQKGYVRRCEVNDAQMDASLTIGKNAPDDVRQKKLRSDFVLVMKPQPNDGLSQLTVHSHSLPLVQDYIAAVRCRKTLPVTSPLLLGSGNPIAMAFFNPQVSSMGPHSKRKKPQATEAEGKVPMITKSKLFKLFSSPSSMGQVWKSFMEETDFSPPKRSRDGAVTSGMESPIPQELLEMQRSSVISYRDMADSSMGGSMFASYTGTHRCYRHISMVLGDPKARREVGLSELMMAQRKNSVTMYSSPPRADSVAFASQRLNFSLNIMEPVERERVSPVVSPFQADPKLVLYVDLQTEFERLAVREHMFRQQLYRRYRLLRESILKMRALEHERLTEYIRRFLENE